MNWIRVRDRLPEQYENVLVYPDYVGGVTIGYFVKGLHSPAGVDWYEPIGEDPTTISPTHWTPYPDPPKDT